MTRETEYAYITLAAEKMRKALEQEDGALENLQCLLVELMNECGQFWPILSNYVRLLQIQSLLIRPWDAYQAGKKYYKSGTPVAQGIILYLSEIERVPSTQKLRRAIQAGFELLGKISGKKGLVDEFVHEYIGLYGPSNNLTFLKWGYDLEREKHPAGGKME